MLKELSQNSTESDLLLQRIIDALPENIVILDADGNILQVNKSCRDFYSFSGQNLSIGENFLQFLAQKSDPVFQQIGNGINDLIAGRKNFFQIQFLLNVKSKDFWFNLRATNIGEGDMPRFMLNLEDISTSKATEIALRESEQSYRTLAETALDVIIKIDEDNKILFINHAGEKLFGYPTYEITGKPFSVLIPDNDFKHIFNDFAKNVQSEQNLNGIEVQAQYKNGNRFPFEISFGDYSQNGSRYFIGVGRDISHRKIIETANALLASIVESSEDAIVSKNLDGVITSWNKGAEVLYGYTPEEAIGKHISVVIPSYLLAEETVILDNIKKGKRIEHFETLRQHKNGTIKNISLTVSPIKSEKGVIVGASKIARDITERHKSAEELKQSQLMLSLAMQSSKMGVWETDIVTGKVKWSKELEHIFGLEEGGFGNSRDAFYDLLYEADRARIRAEVQNAINERRDYTIEFRFYHSDGSLRWMEGRGKAVYSDKGAPIKVYGIGIDVTDRKLAESNLRESEERYRTLFNSIDEGFCILEMIFDERNKPVDYRFIEINPMFGQLTGLENATGKTAREMVPDLESHWFEIYGKVALTGESIRFTQGSDALKSWFDVYAIRLGGEDSRRVALIFTNITERKLLEQEREEILQREIESRKTAEEANRAKDDFLSVLSHELRTPLNAILGWTRILNMSPLDEDRKLKAVETIERNARLQKNLIEDLLDVSRIISGKMRIESEEVDFVSVVSSAVEMVRPFSESKNISIEFVSEIENQKINGDSTRLNQIVINLLNNAVKFTPENGKVFLFLSVDRNKLRLNVSDSGIGISPEFLPFIFDRFRQADSTIVRNHSGLGLGLTIVSHLTELHGGTIRAESDGAGKGSSFILELPLQTAESDNETSSDPENNENFQTTVFLNGKHILLVDDDCDGIEPIQVLLENRGATAVCVNSAFDALKEIEINDFDLIISDIGMPETDGFQLVRQIREIKKSEVLPAIALTAYAGAEDRQRALTAGFQYHLAKPVDFELLLKTISIIFKQMYDQN
ncbi:MAG: PAS domain S-box protein [Pyrinomonadaceae bacterium]|nr:PAS domain S-box protein [Pyrinomonadaceae bacterium]